MRCAIAFLTFALLIGASRPAIAMCPFCAPASATLSEQAAESDAVALARLVKTTKAKDNAAATTTLEVVSVLKNFGNRLEEKGNVQVAGEAGGKTGDLFLLMGTAEGRDAKAWTWDAPQPISEIGFYYLKQAPGPEAAKDKRLRYFLKFLEYPDPLLATDAYSEFAKANYDDLVLIKDAFSRKKIQTWIENPDTLASRLGLYGLMLGISGDKADAELLKAKILDDADKTRLGIDGIMGGYLLLTGEAGMDLLEKTKIKNPKAPIADVHAAMAAFRFLWQYGHGVIPNGRLRSAMRLLVDRPGVADMAIADLARWQDWSVQDRLMEIYKKGNPDNPLGEIAVRRAIIRYMIAGTLDGKDDPEPPPYVAKAKKHLETLRQLDPRTVENFERLMRRE